MFKIKMSTQPGHGKQLQQQQQKSRKKIEKK